MAYKKEYQKKILNDLKNAVGINTDEISSLNDLPSDIKEVFMKEYGPISDRNGPFARGCISSKGEPHKRFVIGYKKGDKYYLSYEYGGICHGWDYCIITRTDDRNEFQVYSNMRRNEKNIEQNGEG